MNCKTCMHEGVCMFRADFIELYTKASNDVYGSVFDVACNEYSEKESFKLYHKFDLNDENIKLLRKQIEHAEIVNTR